MDPVSQFLAASCLNLPPHSTWHTVLLQDVKAYDEYGNPLDSTQYTLLSRNGDFFDFTNQMPSTPVPEPISMLLFGTGIVGVGGYIRKRFKQN
jgi:hypothetical protein